MVTAAAVAKTRTVGGAQKAWDAAGGRPDPYVVVELAGKPVYVSGKQSDTLAPRWFTGTSAWPLQNSASVRIIVRDADMAKGLARIGVAGVSLRPDVPNAGKRILNDVLLGIDTDDVIASWKGTLGQLVESLGGVNRTRTLAGRAGPKSRFEVNAGLQSLTVRVIARPTQQRVGASGGGPCLGFTDAHLESKKRGSGFPWDAGLGGVQNPDPRYLVYVNGEAVVAGAINQDTFVAAWPGVLPTLKLQNDDLIALALFDADAGTKVASRSRHALLFSPSLSPKARDTLFEELVKASTDDLIYLWVGEWRLLAARGARFAVPTTPDPGVWVNHGLSRATVITANVRAMASGPPKTLVIESVAVQATRPNGKSWDIRGGAPDLLVKCFAVIPGSGWTKVGETLAAKNSARATLNFRISDPRLLPGRLLRLEVYDKDGASNDLVGTLTTTIPMKSGRRVERKGQITALSLRFL